MPVTTSRPDVAQVEKPPPGMLPEQRPSRGQYDGGDPKWGQRNGETVPGTNIVTTGSD